jgi:molecular chaperone DnaK (HSP70)
MRYTWGVMRLGIDFGTTRTVVSLCDRGNYPVLSFDTAQGDAVDGIPTIVAARGGELRHGLDALAVKDDAAWTVLRSFKRALAADGAMERSVDVGGERVPLFDVLVGFLSHVRDAILSRSNLPKAHRAEPEMRAVIATPANALGTARFMTLEAFRRAGFDVVATLNEPSAAGFEYTHAHQRTISKRRDHVIVYDLGGGTFDASLVRVTDLRHDALVTGGVARLGGDDFDAALLDIVIAQRGAPVDAASRERWLEACREAKERVGPNTRKLVVEVADEQVTIPVGAYYDACTPLVERTIDAMLPVMKGADASDRRDTDGAQSTGALDEIAGIYVVGGASTLPVVSRVLKERFGRRVFRSPYPSAATAVGLAIAADDTSGFTLSDRFSRALGVFREAGGGRDVTFDVIFDRETALPPPGGPPVRVERRYRVAHDVGHFRVVEATDVADGGSPTGDLSLFADVRFGFVPELQRDGVDLAGADVHRLGVLGTSVVEAYELDAHGLVRMSITDEQTGFARTFALTR